MNRRVLLGVLAGVTLGALLLVPSSAQFSGGQFTTAFRATGDGLGTVEPNIPLDVVSSFPRVLSMPEDSTIGSAAFIQPTDGTHKCEGRIAVRTPRGVECLVTEAP